MPTARVLYTAEALFYRRGIQPVGMDDVRDALGGVLKRLYRLFPSKEQLVVAVLQRRDVQWRQQLAVRVEHHEDRETRILAVFDCLKAWCAGAGFTGCAWVNCYNEIGAVSAPLRSKPACTKPSSETTSTDSSARPPSVSKRATASSGRAPVSSRPSPDSCDAARNSVQETTISPPDLAPFVCTSTPDHTHTPDHAGCGVAGAGFAPCLERNPPRW